MRDNENNNGFHIGFCGIDGSGKTTQAELLCRWLKDLGVNAIFYEEKRNFVSEITDTIARRKGFKSGREYLGEQRYMMCISFEVLRQNIINIRPYTSTGLSVVSSRTIFDWLAGAIARKCHSPELDFIKEIIFFRGLPDLILWLDTTPEVAQQRVTRRKFDTANLNYLKNYRQAFELILKNFSHKRIFGDPDIETVHENITKIIEGFLYQIR